MANARLDELDYYALLKVPKDAPADHIKRAFHRFAGKYHPDRHLGQGAKESRVEKASEIYRRGTEAYGVLSHPVRRKLYDAGLAEGRKRFDPDAAAPASAESLATWPVKVRNPGARPFATKAERAYKAGDFKAAHFNLKLALNKDRDHPQMTALLEAVAAKMVKPDGG